ncbi:MAG TPA: type II toxin-antitoxin system death-on-curing family toxin [Opitutaceae bacterium]
MKEPIWLTREEVLAFHEEQLREHGGLAGVRDENALEGALARPRNLFLYEKPDLHALAATYAHGIAKNHPFNDGNKRAAFISAYVFLGLNGVELSLTETQAVEVMLALAAGKLDQNGFADCLRKNSER